MATLDTEILDFISRHIDTLAALEMLLLLRRSPETFWTADAAADQLGITRDTAYFTAGRLHTSGLLARAAATAAYRFAPPDANDRRRVDRLAAQYEQDRAAVLNAIRSRGNCDLTADDDSVRA